MRFFAVFFISLALGCGSAAPSPRSAADADAPLDWALLLPIETDGLVRVDLARVRRSPHRDSVQPVFDDLLAEMADPAMRQSFEALLARTDLILVALLPPGLGTEEEILILARGRYRPDEVDRLEAGGPARAVNVEGHRVWVGSDPGDGTAVAQLRPDTLAMTATLRRMEHLIARTRMPAGSPRWPPLLRALIEASQLEHATFGLALANHGVSAEDGEIMALSFAGTANVDGPLDVEVVMELGDPTLAAAATIFFEALVQELAASAAGESFALGQLAELTRIEANGTRIRGTMYAEAATAQQLVPGLMGLLRDGLEEGEESPEVASPLPAPTPI